VGAEKGLSICRCAAAYGACYVVLESAFASVALMVQFTKVKGLARSFITLACVTTICSLTYDERKYLRLIDSTVHVSRYTDHMDTCLHVGATNGNV